MLSRNIAIFRAYASVRALLNFTIFRFSVYLSSNILIAVVTAREKDSIFRTRESKIESSHPSSVITYR